MKKTTTIISPCLIAILSLFACTSEQSELAELDLLSYGMPIVIKAPPNPEVRMRDYVVQKDLTVKKGQDFYLQIFEADATDFSVGTVKKRVLEEVRQNRFFDELVEEHDAGFIYRLQIDTLSENYDFRYIRIQGDKEYVFQSGLIGQFSLEDVQLMYEAVEQ